MKKIAYSRHALERMEQRGITREYVRQALRGPYAKVVDSRPGKREITTRLKDRNLCVVVNENADRFFVITTYWEG